MLSVFHNNVDKIDKQEAKFIKAFVKKNLQYEYAVFIDTEKIEPLTGILPEKSYKNGSVDFHGISQVRMEREEPEKEEMIVEEAESEEEEAMEPK